MATTGFGVIRHTTLIITALLLLSGCATLRQFEQIWREQCEASITIRTRHGERAALDYLVGEKLLLFTSTARTLGSKTDR